MHHLICQVNETIPGYKNPSLQTVIHRIWSTSFLQQKIPHNQLTCRRRRSEIFPQWSFLESMAVFNPWARFFFCCGFVFAVIFGFVLETVWKHFKLPLFSSPQQKSFMCEDLVVPSVRANKLIHNMAVHVSWPRNLVFDSDLFKGNGVVHCQKHSPENEERRSFFPVRNVPLLDRGKTKHPVNTPARIQLKNTPRAPWHRTIEMAC